MSALGSSTGLRWPTALCELDVSERLIVWSFRRWASGAEHWSAVRQEFCRQFSPNAAQHALSAFADFVHTIRGRARRVIHYHQPYCPCLCADEVCVLNVIAATQWEDLALSHATSRWLVHDDGIEMLLIGATILADVMASQNLSLPQRVRGSGALFPTLGIPPSRMN
jgi:hypothetical protein